MLATPVGRMKILIANKFFFRNGGSEVVLFQERNFLLKSGVEVIDFSMQDERNFESAYATYFVENQSYGRGSGDGVLGKLTSAIKFVHSSEAVRKIGQLIDTERPDIVHCHNIYHQLTPSIIGAAKRRGVPVVLTLHDYKPACPAYLRMRNGQVCSECIDHGFSRVLANRCADGSLGKSALLYAEAVVQKWLGSYEKVDVFLAPSAFLKDSVTKNRLPRERVQLLYNGIDTHVVQASTDDGGYILYIGRLSHEKGVRTLLEAHAMLDRAPPLVVAGTGPLESELKARYSNAKFIGHVTGDTLHQAIRAASVIVVPSEWYENCPMSVLEAMAYGKPVIASDIGGIPELVAHGETGLLFEPGNSRNLCEHLQALMGDLDRRHEYGTAARQRIEAHFSLERHNQRLMEVYSSLLKGRDAIINPVVERAQ